MIKKIFTLLLFAAFAAASQLQAQNLTVSGTVADATSGEPMPFVNVALMRTHDTIFMRGATTDPAGRFTIADVAPDQYLLQASFVGYEPHLVNLEILENLENLDIKLRAGTTLQTVEIVSDKPLYAMDGEKNLYNTAEDPSIQTGTASDALQNAPGVEVDAEGNITLRGVSSVEIWINDRPSHMNEEALKQYIKTLPANAIDRIEVITNPSARYSTSGGVINIVTNQHVTRNELLCLGVRANTMPSLSPWASYVWANEKVDVNFYLNANYGQHDMASDGTSTLLNDAGDTSRYTAYNTTMHNNNFGGYTGLNFNWNISDRTHLSTWAGFYPYWGNNHSTSNFQYTEYLSVRRDLGYQYDSRSDDGFFWGGYVGAWLEHRIDTTGKKLSFSLNGNTSNHGGYGYETYAYDDPARDTLRRRQGDFNHNPHLNLSLDYVHPMKHDWELSVGASYGFGSTSSNKSLDTLGAMGNYDNVPLRSIEMEADFNTVAAYMTLQKRWGGFTAKLGLRFEEDFANGFIQHPTLNDRVDIDTSFPGFVPSIHLSYQTQNFTSYSLSYTRRFSHSEDFSNYYNFCRYDDYSFATGNPNLRMAYTHNLEAAFNKYVMGFGNIGFNAYLRANTDEIGTMTYSGYAPAYFPASQLVNYTRPENIGSSHTEGLETNIMYRPSGFFNVRFNASVFNYAYDYQGFSDSKVSWSARLNLWAKVWNKLEVFANARYSSPRLGLYSLTNANKGIDFGCSADFLDRKLSLFFNVNDIFGWSEWGSNTTAPSYQTTGSQRYNSRFVSLGLTWRIGKMELESKARQGATESNTPQM